MQWGGGGEENRVQKDVDSKFPAHPSHPFPASMLIILLAKSKSFKFPFSTYKTL